jgi:hypothetical protein
MLRFTVERMHPVLIVLLIEKRKRKRERRRRGCGPKGTNTLVLESGEG